MGVEEVDSLSLVSQPLIDIYHKILNWVRRNLRSSTNWRIGYILGYTRTQVHGEDFGARI